MNLYVCVAVQSRKLEKQVEKLKVKTAQQAEDIERLRSENTEIASLQVHTCFTTHYMLAK